MTIILYNNNSNNKTITKNLSSETTLEGYLRDNTNIEFPQLILKGIYTSFNYCYIPMWQRYYFIEDIIIHGNTTLIKCTIDVLHTYKNDILNSFALLNQASSFNPYYDGGYQYESRDTMRRLNFENNFNSDGSLVLISAAYPFES